MRTKSVVALIGLICLIGGCTYSGNIDKSFYQPSHRDELHGGKYPVSVAVVNGPALKNRLFTASAGGHGVEIPLGDPLCGALEAELANLFVRTGIVEDASKGDYDLYVYPDVEWIEKYRHWNKGILGYRVKFRAHVQDERNRLTVRKFAAERDVVYTPPPEALGARAVMGASLFVLAPITVPITTQAVGQKAKELIGQTIGEFVREFGDTIANDGGLRDFAALLRPGAVPKEQDAIPASSNPYRRAKSKYDPLLDAVVKIRAGNGFGSGFFVSDGGLIVTNRHVVGNERNVTVKMRDGAVTVGEVIARNASVDLALVRVKERRAAFLRLSNGEHAGIGNDVIAIGTPEGLDWSVSRGIISAVRTTPALRLIQTDAAINHGNSGGPLIDLASGYVVGVNTIGVRKDIAEGLSFAVSSEDVQTTFADHLGQADRAR